MKYKSLTVEQLSNVARGVEGSLTVLFGDDNFSTFVGVGTDPAQIAVMVTRDSVKCVAGLSSQALADATEDTLATLHSAVAYQAYQEWNLRSRRH